MPSRVHKRGIVGYSKKSALLEEAITHMNTGKYGHSLNHNTLGISLHDSVFRLADTTGPLFATQ